MKLEYMYIVVKELCKNEKWLRDTQYTKPPYI